LRLVWRLGRLEIPVLCYMVYLLPIVFFFPLLARTCDVSEGRSWKSKVIIPVYMMQ